MGWKALKKSESSIVLLASDFLVGYRNLYDSVCSLKIWEMRSQSIQ
jgi:hypothetical protein